MWQKDKRVTKNTGQGEIIIQDVTTRLIHASVDLLDFGLEIQVLHASFINRNFARFYCVKLLRGFERIYQEILIVILFSMDFL